MNNAVNFFGMCWGPKATANGPLVCGQSHKKSSIAVVALRPLPVHYLQRMVQASSHAPIETSTAQVAGHAYAADGMVKASSARILAADGGR